MDHFVLHSEYKPTGDQPQAIEKLVAGFREGNQCETLLGVTGSGKTFTMANVIAALNKPTIILAHNKTLAAQLFAEMKEFFPENAVEYFVSYYDYYQPEAYIAQTDTYIEKDSSINDEIDRLRLSATASLSERKDVIVISSVSCIYGLGSPKEFRAMAVSIRRGQKIDRDELIHALIEIQYLRNDMNLDRNCFRVRGDVVEIAPSNEYEAFVRVEFFGPEVDRLSEIDPVTGKMIINGIKEVYGADRYYVDGDLQKDAGVVKVGAYFYYVGEEGRIVKEPEIEVVKTNGRIPAGTYKANANGVLILDGVLTVDGNTAYYKNNKLGHRAGLVEYNGDFYYVLE